MIKITTPKGTDAVEKAMNLATPRGTVLTLLYEVRQGLEVEDLQKELNTDDAKTLAIVRSLINDGLAQEV